MKRILSLAVVIIFCFISFCYALETDTHEAINEHIARNTFNGFSLDSYLKNQLGMQGGINETVNSQYVWWWLKKGGLYEDIPYWYMPYLRSVNHFHNPLTDKGFSGIWGTGFLSGESSIQWSQKPIGTQSPGGYYSWHDVRDYFYKALTSIDKIAREKNFSETFRGLGQLMHLVEDLSVPEHTRDDGHYLLYNYEKWIKDNPGVISQYTPIYFELSAIRNPNPLAPVPIANLFDTNQYNGTNPNITIHSNIGLSEYTNSHFLSPDTMFINAFPYPSWSSVVEYDEVIDPTTGKVRTYLKKIGYGETTDEKIGYGEAIQHLAAGKWFYKYLPPDLKRFGLKLDKTVYEDYAEKLIPRAVGYSAGLLNYFFRGEMDMVADDVTGSGYVIENKTDEDMSGTFELWYDNDKDERAKVSGASWTLAIGKKSSGNNKSTNLTIYSPSDFKEPCKYILVFRGRMGQEQGAVVGKVVKAGECVTGRLVQATQTSVTINLKVYTESGLISGSFNIPNSGIISVRFDLSNYDKVVVLTKGYEFHEFTIDEPNKTINYDGIVLKLESSIWEESVEIMPNCREPVESCWVYYSRQGDYTVSYYKAIYHGKGISLRDFYYDNSIIPFGFFNDTKGVTLGFIEFCGDKEVYGDSLGYLENIPLAGIYYGGEKISSLQEEYCIGGTVPSPPHCGYDFPLENRCIGFETGDIIDRYTPIAVFNGSDYAYIHTRLQKMLWGGWLQFREISKEIVSPVPLPWPIPYIKTMLRKDSGYSFYYGNTSVASGLGTIAGLYLVSDDNPYSKHIGWDGNGNIIKMYYKDGQLIIKTLKSIGGSFSGYFDVSLKFPER